MPNDEKKKFFKKNCSKNLLGYVVSKCDKFADCFFDKNKPLFLRSNLEEHEKNKQHLCQINVLSSNFSSRLVECSFVKLTERFLEKEQTTFCWMSVNDGEKKFGQTFFHQKLV